MGDADGMLTPQEPLSNAVGVIGLGAIGGHVARALSRAGWKVWGHDVRAQAFDQFPEAEPAGGVRELAEASRTVLVAVYDDEQLRDVMAGLMASWPRACRRPPCAS